MNITDVISKDAYERAFVGGLAKESIATFTRSDTRTERLFSLRVDVTFTSGGDVPQKSAD